MNVAAAGITPGLVPASFEIKSTQLPLVALHLKTDCSDSLARDLGAAYGPHGAHPDFFDDDGVVLDFSALTEELTDLPALLAQLRLCRLLPVAARGGSAQQMHAAAQAGLLLAQQDVRRTPPRQAAAQPLPEPPTPPTPSPPVPPELVQDQPPVQRSTVVIDKPLRSGQKAYVRGADLVVLAMVNAGAEVAADGHIHIYAPLRGKALAGARGDTSARIFALCMEPELVSIAGIYRTSETALSADVRGKPAQIRLGGADADKLLIEPLRA